MNKIKEFLSEWNFIRIFRLVLGSILLIAYFSTKDNMYLAIGIFLMFQAIFNMGCAGGACATNIPHKNDKTVMEFEKYESSKTNKNV